MEKSKSLRQRVGRRKLTKEEIATADARLKELLLAQLLLATGNAEEYLRRTLRVDDVEGLPVGRLLVAACLLLAKGIVPLGDFAGAAAVIPVGPTPERWLLEHSDEATIDLFLLDEKHRFGAAIPCKGLADAVDRLRLIALEQLGKPPREALHHLPRPKLQQLK